MREIWARRIAYLTGMIVLLLAIYFSWIQNPPTSSINMTGKDQSKMKSGNVDDVDVKRLKLGIGIYAQQGCAMCHSIQGQGNPRYPLDGVGNNLSIEEIHNWVIGDESIKDQLSMNSYKLKQLNRELTDDELQLLVYYLQNVH